MDPKQQKFSIGYFLLTLVALLVLQAIFFAPHPENLPYSEFKRLLQKGKVKDLTLGKQIITGTLVPEGLEGLLTKDQLADLKREGKGAHRFITARVDDPALVGELEKANIRFTGTVENTWLSTLISWVVPALIFFGLWAVLVRRLGAQSGLLALGKSRAKVYVEKKTGVTFDDVAGIDEAKEELVEVVD